MGARFEALFMGVLTAVSNLGCIFFRILTSDLEQCVWLTAGVCEQCLGGFLRLLLTAGVCKQRFSLVLRPLLTASIWDQRPDTVLRLLPTTGLCDQCLGTVP